MVYQQSKIAYITGTSRGIGEALAKNLLERGYQVIGISRSNTIEHPNFSHVQLDLNDLEAVKSFSFDHISDHALLINNAGAIGEIEPVGAVPNETIETVMTVNTLAPQLMINNFIRQCERQKANHFHVITISSGAGKRAIDAWASYCASKAAIDLFSQTIQTEWDNRELANRYIHAIAPGVVDTQMQTEIRSAKPESFKELEKFKTLKNENELSDPKQVASKILEVISNPNHFSNVLISVRDF